MNSLLHSRTHRTLAASLLLIVILSGATQSAQASTTATPKPSAPTKAAGVNPKLGTPCTTAGATTTVPTSPSATSTNKGAQTLTCTKALSGKLVWTASTSSSPMIAGGPNGGPGSNPAMAGAFAKYTACLKAQGVTLPAFGGRRGFGGPDDNNGGGMTSTTPAPRPTLSAKQQAAMAKCASLRPTFGRGGFGGPANSGTNSGGGFGGGVANTPANIATYISCLNTNGVNISTLADLQGLDRQSPKIAAALAACRSKRVAQGPGN